jgi:hypothetical protein
MSKRTKRGLVRKYYIFLVNLKGEIENNEEVSIFNLLRVNHIDTRLQKAIYQLKIVSRGRIKSWLVDFPTLDMAEACIKQIKINRDQEKIKNLKPKNLFSDQEKTDRYYNTTHKEYQRLNPEAVRVGKGYYHPIENKRKWREIFSFKFFNLKCKFFKLK